jgi:hypothetical protein
MNLFLIENEINLNRKYWIKHKQFERLITLNKCSCSFYNTSRRSNRIIDYLFASGIEASIQTYEGPTTSDHKPLICSFSCEYNMSSSTRITSWNVFNVFLSYTYGFWELQWSNNDVNNVYDVFVEWLAAVAARCSKDISKKKTRLSIPPDLRDLLARSRVRSFSTCSRNTSPCHQRITQGFFYHLMIIIH